MPPINCNVKKCRIFAPQTAGIWTKSDKLDFMRNIIFFSKVVKYFPV